MSFITKVFVSSVCVCAGNLYSREVQVDGEQVTIQVQDTPGVEVRNPPPPERGILQGNMSGLVG